MNELLKKSFQKYIEEQEQREKNFHSVSKLLDKIKIPKHWRVSFSGYCLDITHSYICLDEDEPEDAPLSSFVDIIKQFESLGFKFEKAFYTGFYATASSTVENPFVISIVQGQIDKCEIEYVDEVQPERTIKKPVLSGFCAEVLK